MKPLVIPASTSLAGIAGAATILLCVLLRRFGIELTVEEQSALIVILTVAAGHFTIDTPSAPIAREAVAVAADAAVADAKDKVDTAQAVASAKRVNRVDPSTPYEFVVGGPAERLPDLPYNPPPKP